MKYVLVDNNDNVVDRVDLESEVGISGARTFFIGRKQIPYENFIQLWKVMTEDEYVVKQAKKPIEWWIEDKEITDSELKF
jgi:hypothetical protein|tara:strand:+ start:559 stop:798 length:240 start_codon:yes stop_codon:yes gene_type:complete